MSSTFRAMEARAIVKELTESGCLVKPEVAESLSGTDLKQIRRLPATPLVVNETFLERLRDHEEDIVTETSLEVEKHFAGGMEEKDVEDFVAYFNDRITRIREILRNRRELENAMSIARLEEYGEKEDVSVIGMVRDKYKTSSGRWIVYLEDSTGETKILLDEEDGEWLLEDEVIGISGVTGDDIIFANEIVRPDLPITRDVTTTDEEVYAVFLSDIHYGSIDTLDDYMDRLAEWFTTSEEAKRVGYLFVVGDMVEGVGNYPGQREELEVEDIYKQYERFEEFVEEIPDRIEIVVIPGNHDFVRLAEPQPPIPEDVAPRLYDRDNVHMLSNPATVLIHGHAGDPIRVLLYHGYSMDGHIDEIKELREKAYDEPHHAMVDYLRRRHLAPMYGSNLLAPEDRDYMVIDEVPDIFAIGHSHAFDVANYKGVNLISAGTMQAQTDFQKRMGHEPDPGEIAMVNLQTRDTTVKEL
ncbi:MAG: DNA-directed DNA polymerase II small subunit [Candidatus Nanohaloarchaeota archaeon QJJ-5]|nr:DNA-directed DNA polymerase II small subunit [Candidatus Nanohaloarchaeota archaeon QJJ-5]